MWAQHVFSYDVGVNPSTQRHYRRLIHYLYIYIATCFGRTTIIRLKIYYYLRTTQLTPTSYDITRATGCKHPRLSQHVFPYL
jgi:hypothetical protein